MTDPLLDDAKALLDKDFGDDRILKQICRACEHNEILSNYERNYVKKLAEKHLNKKPEFIQISDQEKSTIPDIVIPSTQQSIQTQTFSTKSRRSFLKRKSKKVKFGIGVLVLIVIIAAAVSFSGFANDTSGPGSTIALGLGPLSIQTDLESYNNKDLISISGTSDTSGAVTLSIVNQNNELVWTEEISLKNDGRFSTLSIAGGSGWEQSGTYTIKVNNGKETKSNVFSFVV